MFTIRAELSRRRREALRDSSRPPHTLPVRPSGIPDEMRKQRRWMLWRWEWNQKRGEWTKVPRQPDGTHASSTNPLTWSSFETVVQALSHCGVPGGPFSGIGFALGDGWAGVDLDSCRDPETCQLEATACDIISTIESYTEVSPTATGVKAFAHGTLPAGRRKRGNVETYDTKRFFVVTGFHLQGTPGSVEERTAQLADVHVHHVADRDDYGPDQRTNGALDDDDVLALARRAHTGRKFSALFDGRWEGSYDSQSEADQALVRLFYFLTGGNRDRIDRLFRRSGLFRPKWDSRRGSSTYGHDTISKIIESGGPVYSAKPPAQAHLRDAIARICAAASILGSGTSAATDGAVLLVLTDCATRIGSLELGASFRWIAERTGIHLSTAHRSIQRIVKRGFLSRIRGSDGPHATRWKLQVPSICAPIRTVSMHRQEEDKTVRTDAQIPAHPSSIAEAAADPGDDAWRWRAMGKAKFRVYARLGEEPISTHALTIATKTSYSAVSRHLRALERVGLALRTGRRYWWRGQRSPEDVARELGTAGKRAKEKAKFERDRAEHQRRLQGGRLRLAPR